MFDDAVAKLAQLAGGDPGGSLRVSLKSSWLEAMEYDPQSSDLTITTQAGNAYTYPGISADIAYGLASASSPGSFYDKTIKLKK